MITALAAQGHRHAAINHYDSYRNLMCDELGVAPPQQTVELYDQLMADRWRVKLVNFVPFHNLPTTIHPTIGRVAERKHIANLLAQKDCRLLTLAGIGGSGKTQLALDVAWAEVPNFHNGSYFVNLTDVPADKLITMIVRSLPIAVHPQANLKFQLLSWLREKEVLIVLDNFDHADKEHVISTLLQVAPSVSIIVTAPMPLKIRGEHVVTVQGVSLPENDSVEGLESCTAVQLFLQYTRQIKPHFTLSSSEDRSALFTLCRMVGGLPLGLELIAYLSATYPLTEIAARLAQDPEFLSCANYRLPGRHISMASVYNDVWQQLSDQEQHAFIHLCAFGSSFSMNDVTQLAEIAPNTFFNLQIRSLVQTTRSSVRPGLRPFLPLNNHEIRYEIIPIFRIYQQNKDAVPQLMESVLVA